MAVDRVGTRSALLKQQQIDAHPQHILSLTNSPTSTLTSDLLSPTELAYLKQHLALLAAHYNASFLSSFPPKLRRLDDRAGAGGVGMIEGPDLDKAVWVRCLGVPQQEGSSRRHRREYDAEEDLMDGGRVVVDRETEEALRRGDESDKWRPVEVSCGFTSASRDDADDTDGPSQYSSTQRSRRSGRSNGGERVVEMRRGEIWLVRWSSVREAVTRGECELI